MNTALIIHHFENDVVKLLPDKKGWTVYFPRDSHGNIAIFADHKITNSHFVSNTSIKRFLWWSISSIKGVGTGMDGYYGKSPPRDLESALVEVLSSVRQFVKEWTNE